MDRDSVKTLLGIFQEINKINREFLLNVILRDLSDNVSALVQIKAWYSKVDTGENPLPKPMMT